MTHGDKAKGKKTASKASGSKKSSKAVEASKAAKSSKSAKSGKEGGGKKAVQASAKAVEAPKKQQAGSKAVIQKVSAAPKSAGAKGSNGKPAPRGPAVSGEAGFSNPVIANAFKRAIKKFPTAFRKLTD